MTTLKKFLKAPFVYFGGKSQIADKIWELLGNPEHYLEPFAGSLAVLLARPNGLNLPLNYAETVNDKDCMISNVWRALKNNPEEVARYSDDIVSSIDLYAKKFYVTENLEQLKLNMMQDPEFCNPKLAGYFLYILSSEISIKYKLKSCNNGMLPRPHLSDNGHGICKPSYNNLQEWFKILSKRLRRVRIANGDWKQILGGNWQDNRWDTVGIYFDPPYSDKAKRYKYIYQTDDLSVAHNVRKYCKEIRSKKPKWKIILSGYYDEHKELLNFGYDYIQWTANGGYANKGKSSNTEGKINRTLETLFYSDNCNINKMF